MSGDTSTRPGDAGVLSASPGAGSTTGGADESGEDRRHRPTVVQDPDDPVVRRFRLRDRQLAPVISDPAAPHGLFVAEGDLIVQRALDAGYVLDSVLADDRRGPDLLGRTGLGARLGPAPLFLANPTVRERLTGYGVQLDVIALFHRRPLPTAAELVERGQRLVIAEAVDNPANLGATVRSAVAFGYDGMLLDPTGADPFARRCVRASMGWSVCLPTARTRDVAADLRVLAAGGAIVAGFTPDPTAPTIDSVTPAPGQRVAVVLGSERDGLSRDAQDACTHRLRIPMAPGVDSLNVAVAAGIALFAFSAGRTPR